MNSSMDAAPQPSAMKEGAFPSWGTIPTRPRCACCSRVIVVDINVPDDLWCAVMRAKHGPGYVCVDCFASRADEKMIDWAPYITLTPISMVGQIAVQATPHYKSSVQPPVCHWCNGTGNDERDEGFDSKKYPCQECNGTGWESPPVIGIRRSEWKTLSPAAQDKLLKITGAGSRAIRLADAQAAQAVKNAPLLSATPHPEPSVQLPAEASVPVRWWRKRADEIEMQVARSGSRDAMACYTQMRSLLQSATPTPPETAVQAVPSDALMKLSRLAHTAAMSSERDMRNILGSIADELIALATVQAVPAQSRDDAPHE